MSSTPPPHSQHSQQQESPRSLTTNTPTAPRSLLSHLSFSLNALTFFLAFLLVDSLTFHTLPTRSSAAKPTARRNSDPQHHAKTQFLSVPNARSHMRSSSHDDEKHWHERRSRDTRQLQQSQVQRAGWMGSLIGRRRGSEEEIRQLSNLHAEFQSGQHKGELGHYQKKLFERQVIRALALQPYIRAFIVLILLLSASFLFILLVSTPSTRAHLLSSTWYGLTHVVSECGALLKRPFAAIREYLEPPHERSAFFVTGDAGRQLRCGNVWHVMADALAQAREATLDAVRKSGAIVERTQIP